MLHYVYVGFFTLAFLGLAGLIEDVYKMIKGKDL